MANVRELGWWLTGDKIGGISKIKLYIMNLGNILIICKFLKLESSYVKYSNARNY